MSITTIREKGRDEAKIKLQNYKKGYGFNRGTEPDGWWLDDETIDVNAFYKWIDKQMDIAYEAGKKEIEKAYGGCRKCYGKGYATVRYGYSTAPDFAGDKEIVEPPKTHMSFCSCERGKQLKGLLVSPTGERVKV